MTDAKPKPLPRWFAAADRRRRELAAAEAAGAITPAERRELAEMTAMIRPALKVSRPPPTGKLDDRERVAAGVAARADRRRPGSAVRVLRAKAGDCNYAVVYDRRGTRTLLGRFPLLADARGYRGHVLGLPGVETPGRTREGRDGD